LSSSVDFVLIPLLYTQPQKSLVAWEHYDAVSRIPIIHSAITYAQGKSTTRGCGDADGNLPQVRNYCVALTIIESSCITPQGRPSSPLPSSPKPNPLTGTQTRLLNTERTSVWLHRIANRLH
jgi:hypothetical protein